MKTICVDASAPEFSERVKDLGRMLREGGLVAFPTETVYGLGGNALSAESARKIYAAKGRPSDNPLIVHVADIAQARPLVQSFSPLEEKLMETFWPGPLTLVCAKADVIPAATSGGLSTVAIRSPAHPATQALLRAAGVPIAGPSANLSGKPSPTTAADVLADLSGRIDAVIDGGACEIGLESTIVSCADGTITIYRPGAVTMEMLEAFAPVSVDPALLGKTNAKAAPKAPGMKYRHYAPKAPMTVYAGDALAVESILVSLAIEKRNIGFFVSEETAARLPAGVPVFVWGRRGDDATMARRLFAGLHYFDTVPVEEIYGEGTGMTGIGFAIMNRLTKATGYHIIMKNTETDDGSCFQNIDFKTNRRR